VGRLAGRKAMVIERTSIPGTPANVHVCGIVIVGKPVPSRKDVSGSPPFAN
jgi:hypothetical protein